MQLGVCLLAIRYFTQKQANNIGVTGFVSNASDGTVSIATSMKVSDADCM